MAVTQLLATALGPEYTVERELAGGGMAHVLVAYDRRLERRVVVKVLPPELAATVSLERFRREVLLVAGLQHPNIVPVIFAGEAQGLPYLVMPFVEGESLRARLAAGPLRVVETVGILRDVARALAFAHDRGVVHRDVKPDNVLLSSGAAVVADFGVAKAVQSALRRTPAEGGMQPRGTITAAGTTLGTPDYMAPEQIAADPGADHRVDIYAFGAMAYEMLSGAPPFHDRSPQRLLAAHLTEAPRPLPELREGLPAALVRLVMSCLEKEPDQRPASANDILSALEDPAVVSGAFATPHTLPSGSTPAQRRRRTWMAAIASVLLIGGAATGGIWWSQTASPAAAPARVAARATFAVLPMTFIGSDSSQAYVARGIASELTSTAGHVPGLRVLSPAGAERLRMRIVAGEDVSDAVAMFLEGVVQWEGGTLRVDARIVDTSDGVMLWADSFEGTVAERFALQSALSTAVARALAPYATTASDSAGTAAAAPAAAPPAVRTP